MNEQKMNYLDLHKTLKEFYTQEPGVFINSELGITLTNNFFTSDVKRAFPPGDEYVDMNPLMKALMKYFLHRNEYSDKYLLKMLTVPDKAIQENNRFTYSILSPSGTVSNEAIVLLHGLNERGWEKYLPWAYYILKNTGKSVILFPNAFHMNRAPECWSNFRLMKEISSERKNLLPGVILSSPVNAAISTRLQFVPQRFVYSGIQTINDITTLAELAKEGSIQGLPKNTSLDLFGYSIGAFVAEIIMMSNPLGLFNTSRCFLFCGGSTLDKMSPVNKFILDSEATNQLMDFYVHRLEQNITTDERLSSLFKDENEEAFLFKAMLNNEENKTVRERYLGKISDRLYGVALAKDDVMPGAAIQQTLNHSRKKIRFDEIDFEYGYTHENPFPTLTGISDKIDRAFGSVFSRAVSFLS